MTALAVWLVSLAVAAYAALAVLYLAVLLVGTVAVLVGVPIAVLVVGLEAVCAAWRRRHPPLSDRLPAKPGEV
jgi:hypothetical protein